MVWSAFAFPAPESPLRNGWLSGYRHCFRQILLQGRPASQAGQVLVLYEPHQLSSDLQRHLKGEVNGVATDVCGFNKRISLVIRKSHSFNEPIQMIPARDLEVALELADVGALAAKVMRKLVLAKSVAFPQLSQQGTERG